MNIRALLPALMIGGAIAGSRLLAQAPVAPEPVAPSDRARCASTDASARTDIVHLRTCKKGRS
jgi:hypothetical protein